MAHLTHKQQLRQQYRKARAALSPTQLAHCSAQIFSQWFHSPLAHYHHYHLFLPITQQKEINTFPFLDALWKKGAKTYGSKVVGDRLHHYPLTANTPLTLSRWGIWEPDELSPLSATELAHIEVVFVPLLIADHNGQRIGYGRGFYDRFLLDLPHALKVGLSHFPPIPAIADPEAHDIPLDAIITPEKIHWIRSLTNLPTPTK